MRQEEIRIDTCDKHVIYGTLDVPPCGNKNIVIFVHGLAQGQHHHMFYNAVPFFIDRGCSTFRFDLYSGKSRGRRLSECTLSLHVQDIQCVIDYLIAKCKPEHIFLVGHSLGATSILFSNLNDISRIVLWDPAFCLDIIPKYATYKKELDMYTMHFGTECIVSKEMYYAWQNCPNADILLKQIKKPVKIISAGKYVLARHWKNYFGINYKGEDFTIIKGAGHMFDELKTEQKLFWETIKYF